MSFVKGFSAETAGGRGPEGLSELVARPLINPYRPELAGFIEPLSPEFAARRGLLASLPFPAGYGAALSLLFDATREVGVHALAQTRLGSLSSKARGSARGPRRGRIRGPIRDPYRRPC